MGWHLGVLTWIWPDEDIFFDMKNKTISMLKAITREQLLGNYRKLSSYVLLYVLCQTVIANLTLMIKGGAIMQILAGLIGNLLVSVFMVGLLKVCLNTARGKESTLADYFYVFKHDPDKVIIISFVLWFFSELMFLPMILPDEGLKAAGVSNGILILIKCIFTAVFMVVYLFAYILLSQSYLIYLDRPELEAREILMLSVRVMKTNKIRYFYLLFNVFGMMCLIILTLGIAVFWMLPLSYGLMVNFYEDLKGGLNGYNIEA